MCHQFPGRKHCWGIRRIAKSRIQRLVTNYTLFLEISPIKKKHNYIQNIGFCMLLVIFRWKYYYGSIMDRVSIPNRPGSLRPHRGRTGTSVGASSVAGAILCGRGAWPCTLNVTQNQWKSTIYHWFSLIFTNFHWFPLVLIDFYWFSLISLVFNWYSRSGSSVGEPHTPRQRRLMFQHSYPGTSPVSPETSRSVGDR